VPDGAFLYGPDFTVLKYGFAINSFKKQVFLKE
jgi:hypothetical protein